MENIQRLTLVVGYMNLTPATPLTLTLSTLIFSHINLLGVTTHSKYLLP